MQYCVVHRAKQQDIQLWQACWDPTQLQVPFWQLDDITSLAEPKHARPSNEHTNFASNCKG